MDKTAYDSHAPQLAEWATTYLVNRTDCRGGYWSDRPTSRASTTTRKEPVDHAVLTEHFRARVREQLVGLHTTSTRDTCKWLCVEPDVHGEDPEGKLASKTTAAATGWYEKVKALGYTALLEDSNGKGGYHLWVLFQESPAKDVYEFGLGIVSDYASYGLDSAPEVFPKQPTVVGKEGRIGYGNWVRLPGRHWRGNHVSRFWDGTRWLQGEDAVQHLLAAAPATTPVPVAPEAPPVATQPKPQAPKPVALPDNDERPGDRYNAAATQATTLGLLLAHGWKQDSTDHSGTVRLTRPGKDCGASGTVDMRGTFYCFTNASQDFRQNDSYSPFGVLAVLEYDGDFSRAAKAINPKPEEEITLQEAVSVWGDAVPEPDYDGGAVTQHVIKIGLDSHPDAVRQFTCDYIRRNGLVTPIHQFGTAYAVLGAILGKRFYAEEHQVTQYANDWFANLMPTGSAKTGPHSAVSDALLDLDPRMVLSGGTMAGMYGQIGAYISKKDWCKLDPVQQGAEMRAIRDRSMQDCDGRLILTDECTGTLDSLMGGWDSKAPAKDLADLLKLTDSHARLPKMTGGEGYRTIEDACVSFLGFTQNETWQAKYGGEQFKACGLFGRFIPVTSTYLELVGSDCPGDARRVIQEAHAQARALGSSRVRCTFLLPDGDDAIKPVMDTLGEWEHGETLQRVYPEDWERLRSKIVVHGIKASMVEAFLRGDHLDGLSVRETVDCSPYFQRHAAWVTACYLAYLQQETWTSQTYKHEQQIVKLLRKHRGGLTARDIQRRLNFYRGEDFKSALRGLLEDGTVVTVQAKGKNARAVTVYKIAS